MQITRKTKSKALQRKALIHRIEAVTGGPFSCFPTLNTWVPLVSFISRERNWGINDLVPKPKKLFTIPTLQAHLICK